MDFQKGRFCTSRKSVRARSKRFCKRPASDEPSSFQPIRRAAATIVDGQVLIDGVPLDQTQFARDPDQPRQSADVMRLLGDGRHPLHSIRTDSPLPAEGIVVPDIEHPAELERMTGLTSDETLLAGAADFFAALLEARPTTPARSIMPPVQIFPPALVVCGSRAFVADAPSAICCGRSADHHDRCWLR